MVELESGLEQWLEERRSMIGASESPAILGEGYENQNAWTVWARKVGIEPDTDATEAMEWGHAMQPVLLKMFTRKTGIVVEDLGEFAIQRHPDYPWLGATLDGKAMTSDGPAVVEGKNVGTYNRAEWEDDDLPLRVRIQIQHQMLAAGCDIGFAVACIGGNKLVWRREEKNDRFQKAMIASLEKFWQHVLTKTPPPVDGSAATASVMRRLWPQDNDTSILLPPESVEWDRELSEAKAQIKAAEAVKVAAENKLKAALGENAIGDLPGGGSYSWKTQERAGYTVEPTTLRVLRRCK